MAFATTAEVAFGALGGMEIIAKPAFLGVVQLYIANGIGVLAIVLGYDVIVYGAIVTFAAFVPLVASFAMLRPYVHRPFHYDRKIMRHLLRDGMPLMTLTVLNAIYGTVDVPILGSITTDTEVGWYTVAYRWVGIPIFITTAVVTSYFPRFSAHGSPMTADFSALREPGRADRHARRRAVLHRPRDGGRRPRAARLRAGLLPVDLAASRSSPSTSRWRRWTPCWPPP